MINENILINNNKYLFTTNIKNNNILRKSFNNLSEESFKISFEKWYLKNYWLDNYISYSLVDKNKVVANVSVNITNFLYNQNEIKNYIQIGTVMTDKNYRNKGLSNFLINYVLDFYKDIKLIYLFANDSVLNFYPKYNFIKETEYIFEKNIAYKKSNIRKLNLDLENDKNLLIKKYKSNNPFSKLSIVNNFSFIMFYLTYIFDDNIFYLEDLDTIGIITYEENTMTCYDIFSNHNNLEEILSSFSLPNITKVILGFTPINQENFSNKILIEEDSTFFILRDSENLFQDNKLMIPFLSHG